MYRQHVGYVRSLLSRLGAAQQDIDDWTHEVFLTAWRRRADVRQAPDIRAWLGATARYVVLAQRRKASRRREVLSPAPFEPASELPPAEFRGRFPHEIQARNFCPSL